MERERRPSPSELIKNEELNPHHFYAVYEFENADVFEPQITQVVHKALDMGYPVRYWWLSEVAELKESPDKLIIGIHHPSQADDAGLDLYEALVQQYGEFWDLWDGVDVREYSGFGIPVENVTSINKVDGSPLFPNLQPVVFEWKDTNIGVNVNLRMNHDLMVNLPSEIREQVEQTLVGAIGICTAVLENKDVVEGVGGNIVSTLGSITKFMNDVRDFYETRWRGFSEGFDDEDFPF